MMFPTTSCITININVDSVNEGDESFTVLVTSTSPAVVFGANSEATVTIVDIREPIGIEFPAYSVMEGEGRVVVCVVANGLLTQNVEIFLLSQDGSAVSSTG